jgi:hypothetical protein
MAWRAASETICARWLVNRLSAAPSDRAVSFDHLVGAAGQGQWDHKPERPGGLQVDDQF